MGHGALLFEEGAGGSGAEGAAAAGQGTGRQGGDPPVTRQLHSWQGGLYKQTCVVVNKKTCS